MLSWHHVNVYFANTVRRTTTYALKFYKWRRHAAAHAGESCWGERGSPSPHASTRGCRSTQTTLPKHGVNVLDPFHLTDGRLEKSDHTHFGFWAEKESGITNPTLSAQTVNVLLNYLCAKDKFEPQGGGDDNR